MLRSILFFAATAIPMYGQIAMVHVTSCGPQTFPTSTCTIPAVAAGDIIVVGIEMGDGVSTSTTIGSITDNAGNTYVAATGGRSIDTNAGSVADIWYAKNAKAGATTLTVNPSVSVSAGVVVWEFSGVDTNSPLDGAAAVNSQPSSSTVTGITVNALSSNEAVISLAIVAGNVAGIASGNAFVSDSSLKGNGWAHLITSAAGSYGAQWSQNPAGTWASSTVSFKAANGGSSGGSTSACDLNQDGKTNIVDVQLGTNMNLGTLACTANIAGAGVCSSLVVQQVINAALGSACITAVNHSVTLTWAASSTPGVNYNVYRTTTSGSAYTKLNSSPVAALTYLDSTVLSGQTYYYVTTAVDSNSLESIKSNEIPAAVPFP